ncbi:MAG TPA: transcription antitermination factor NusB [Propionibacteriaceae bacterium]|nr:transcription antitermination factor NusB [Propionibacteriaceae bacterium]
MSARTKARKAALDVLFESDLRARDTLQTLQQRIADAESPVRDYTRSLVEGVTAHRSEIDRRIADSLSTGWTLERMPRVDRAAVRIAVYEIDFLDVPDAVAVAEAVALVGDLSTDDSPDYVNGLLGKVIATKTRSGEVAGPLPAVQAGEAQTAV